jgi:hypothetical protein
MRELECPETVPPANGTHQHEYDKQAVAAFGPVVAS